MRPNPPHPIRLVLAISLLVMAFALPHASRAQGEPPQTDQITQPDALLEPDLVESAPAGFTEELVTTVSDIPTSLALTPDGRMLITTQEGKVRVFSGGTLTTVLDLEAQGIVCNEFERGLESITVDPNFATNQRVYIYHTYNGGSGGSDCSGRNGIINRVVRYTLSAANVMTSPQVILNNIASPCGNHNGGDLNFGADGLLYVSTGDGGCQISGTATNNARYRSLLNGKILRINADGSVPAGNLWVNQPDAVQCGLTTANFNGGPCTETFAWGFRNPFRFAIKDGTNQLYVNDVGQNTWEEISDVSSGNDYGWYCREGAHTFNTSSSGCNPTPPNMIDPIYEYDHGSGCSITGGAFAVSGGQWPTPYDGAYYFGDYCRNVVYRLAPGTPYTRANFAVRGGSDKVVDLLWDAQTDALYFSLSNGQVWRVRYTGSGNRAPTAQASANPTSGPAPLAVQFTGSGNDPDGDALTYGWAFGDGGASTAQNPSHIYNASGIFTATLVVTDSKGAPSQPARVTINPGNTPPSAQIISPTASVRFSVGQVFTLTGVATDTQDGNVSATMQWGVLLVHAPFGTPQNSHTHPFFSATGNDKQLPAMPPPEDLDAAPLSYLEIQLTATDSAGLTRTVTQTLQPNRVPVTFATTPDGLRIDVNGAAITATKTITSWQGYGLNVSTPVLQRDAFGQWWKFVSWSDGGAASHVIATTASAATYTATFEQFVPIGFSHLPMIIK